jgi:hypothetical protein
MLLPGGGLARLLPCHYTALLVGKRSAGDSDDIDYPADKEQAVAKQVQNTRTHLPHDKAVNPQKAQEDCQE